GSELSRRRRQSRSAAHVSFPDTHRRDRQPGLSAPSIATPSLTAFNPKKISVRNTSRSPGTFRYENFHGFVRANADPDALQSAQPAAESRRSRELEGFLRHLLAFDLCAGIEVGIERKRSGGGGAGDGDHGGQGHP